MPTRALALALLVAGCGPKSPYPIENIELCGAGCISGNHPNDKVSKTAGLEHTLSWGGEQLNPVVHDSNSKNRIVWDGAFINQEVLAINVDFDSGMPPRTCAPADCFAPIPNVKYVSLMGNSTNHKHRRTKDYDIDTTGQIVRVDHGACRASTRWSDFFGQVSDELAQGFRCAQKCDSSAAFHRVHEQYQPHFTGRATDIRHGFELLADYHIDAYGPLVDVDLSMNPAFELHVDGDTGLVRVKLLQKRVIAVDDSFDKVKPKIEAKLDEMPGKIEEAFEQAFTFRPPISPQCSPSASLASQQQTCYDAMAKPAQGSLAYLAFKGAFKSLGQSDTKAEASALKAVKGLEKRNFVCSRADDDGGQGCRVHPTFRRILVLPHTLEFVLADTFDEERIALYTALSALLPKSDELPDNLCRDLGTREDGEVTYFQRFNLDIDTLSGKDCPPCP